MPRAIAHSVFSRSLLLDRRVAQRGLRVGDPECAGELGDHRGSLDIAAVTEHRVEHDARRAQVARPRR